MEGEHLFSSLAYECTNYIHLSMSQSVHFGQPNKMQTKSPKEADPYRAICRKSKPACMETGITLKLSLVQYKAERACIWAARLVVSTFVVGD